MEFTWPVMLVGLAVVPLLLVGYGALRRWQAQAATAFADAHLLPYLRQGPRLRLPHLPFACYLSAIVLLILASARPVAAIPVPTNQSVLMLAIDTSKSMVANDLTPSRLEVAKTTARDLVRAMPRSVRVGLVAFSDYPQVLVHPTTEHPDVLDAIDRLQPAQATAVGSAILAAVRAMPGREQAGEALLQQQRGQPPTVVPPSAPEALPPGAVVVITDGVTNIGVDPLQAAQVAHEFRVKVYTVGVGTPSGSVQSVDNQMVFIPFDPTGLQQIAQITGGRYFYPPSSDDLRAVARELGRAFAWQRQRTEVTSLVAAAGGVLMLAGGALSLAWFRRVP
ncbi:MAG: VWA domain-containing protein [Armatimonadota bacterium]|nr:VWA domain-containing protein [Armatimonadota bacterium]MDR5697279.1 VWA domain-containing protein [Armatimonadota bacterium]